MVSRPIVYLFVVSHILNWLTTLFLMVMLKDIVGILTDLSDIVARLAGN